MIRTYLRYLGTLFGLQILFGGITFFLADIRLLAVAGSLLFLGLVWVAGRSLAAELGGRIASGLLTAAGIGLVWQLPGLQGTLRFLTDTYGWTEYDGITDLQDFLMETWHSVLLPLVAALPVGLVQGYYARYYILLVAGGPVLAALFVAGALSNYLAAKR